LIHYLMASDGWYPIRSIWCFCWLYHLCSLCSFLGDIIHMLVLSDLKLGPQNVGWIQLAKPVWFLSVLFPCFDREALCPTMNTGKWWPIAPGMAKSKGLILRNQFPVNSFQPHEWRNLHMVKTGFT
jgi:hypothetical protein